MWRVLATPTGGRVTTYPMQVQSGHYGRFILEYPGIVNGAAAALFEEMIRGDQWSAEDLIASARAYRRLTDAQDAEPMPAHEWLVAMSEIDDVIDEVLSEAAAFSAAVRALRAVQGISQADLAARAQVGGRTVAQIESQPDEHRTRHANRLAVADALGWSVDEMVDLGYMVLGR